MKRLYLDANGSCPPCRASQEIIKNLVEHAGNPSSFHEHGRSLRALIDDAREHVAKMANARSREVIFTSGASEANRLFVDALVLHYRQKGVVPSVLTSPFEHPSLLKPLLAAAQEGALLLSILETDATGALYPNDALGLFDVLICCEAHNETGIMPPLHQLIETTAPSTLIMSDVSQSIARAQAPHPRIDVLTFSAQKMGGFAGSGALIMRNNGKILRAPWPGGGQERGFRPGTESALLIAAFGEAARMIESTRNDNLSLESLRDYFEEQLARLDCFILGKTQKRLPNTSAVCFVKANPDALRIACDMAGLSVGFGAACSGLAPEGSFALKRLGLTLAQEKTTVRFSFAPGTTKEDIDTTLERIEKIYTIDSE